MLQNELVIVLNVSSMGAYCGMPAGCICARILEEGVILSS
jgi:hypothetical protein